MARILVIDPNELSRRSLTALLTDAGHEVDHTRDEAVALELIARIQYDLAIAEYQTRGEMTGLDILAQHGRLHPDKHRILIASEINDEVFSALKATYSVCLRKPVAEETLSEVVARYVRNS